VPLKISLMLIFLVGCGSGSALVTEANSASYNVYLVFTPVAPGPTGFTAELDGKTYDSPGASTASLSTGTHKMTGSFRGSGFVVSFATIDTGGGVKSGSARSVSGPAPKVNACGIAYSTDNPTAQHDFQLEFTVDATGSGALCGGTVP
jgi:hypothetical protein